MALSNNEKYIIQGMLNDGHPLTEIAEALDKPYKSIQYYVSTLKDSLQKIEDNKKAEEDKLAAEKAKKKAAAKKAGKMAPVKPLTVGDLILNRTVNKKERGVAVMTKGASELADEHFKHLDRNPDLSHKIHKIKEE